MCGALVAGTLLVPQQAVAATFVTLLGHGYGHGRGMGQWGAYGYAVDQGWSSATILDHYYGGTVPGNVGNPIMTVRLTALDGAPGTWVTSAQPFTVGGVLVDGGSAARVVRSGGTWRLYTSYGGCGAPNSYGPSALPADPAMRTQGSPGDDPRRMLTTCATGRSYRGELHFPADGSATRVVNHVYLDEYLRGVVPRESPASWGDAAGGRGMAALEAQAVAARSYSMAERRYGYAQTCDTIACQVYGGAAAGSTSQEDARTDRAIAATAGVVRVRPGGGVVRTEFSSSTGGHTTGPDFRHVVDLGDSRSPYSSWRVTLQGTDIQARYPSVGTFQTLRVTRRDGEGVQGGRPTAVDVIGSSGRVTVTGDQFRSAMGLRSGWFFPLSELDGARFVRTAYSDVVYRQVWARGWNDHDALSPADFAAEGYPAVSAVGSDYVKYPWSPTVYAVTFWPGDPTWQWDRLDAAAWARAGYPPPRVAGWISGTAFWKYANSPEVFAEGPDGVVHQLTYQEWFDAGLPRAEIR